MGHPPSSPSDREPGPAGSPPGKGGTAFARSVDQFRLALSFVRLRPFDVGTPLGRSNERYRRIALTTLSSFGARGVGSVIGLFSVPLLLGYLGKERFGLGARSRR